MVQKDEEDEEGEGAGGVKRKEAKKLGAGSKEGSKDGKEGQGKLATKSPAGTPVTSPVWRGGRVSVDAEASSPRLTERQQVCLRLRLCGCVCAVAPVGCVYAVCVCVGVCMLSLPFDRRL
jgi:hypothetical protein